MTAIASSPLTTIPKPTPPKQRPLMLNEVTTPLLAKKTPAIQKTAQPHPTESVLNANFLNFSHNALYAVTHPQKWFKKFLTQTHVTMTCAKCGTEIKVRWDVTKPEKISFACKANHSLRRSVVSAQLDVIAVGLSEELHQNPYPIRISPVKAYGYAKCGARGHTGKRKIAFPTQAAAFRFIAVQGHEGKDVYRHADHWHVGTPSTKKHQTFRLPPSQYEMMRNRAQEIRRYKEAQAHFDTLTKSDFWKMKLKPSKFCHI